MKATLLLLAAAATPAFSLEKAMPDAFPEDRYAAMITRSPFGLATPVAAPVVADKSFADGWYLAGVAQVEGKNYITVRSRDQSAQFALFGDERNTHEGPGNGVKLQNVEWSPTYGKTSATIEKDGQFAKIDLPGPGETGAGAPAAAMAPGGIARPPAINPVGARPGGAPAFPQPGVQPQQRNNVIPRPTGQPVAPAAPSYQITPGLAPKAGALPAAPAAAPAGDGRRRIRVIPSQPTQ